MLLQSSWMFCALILNGSVNIFQKCSSLAGRGFPVDQWFRGKHQAFYIETIKYLKSKAVGNGFDIHGIRWSCSWWFPGVRVGKGFFPSLRFRKRGGKKNKIGRVCGFKIIQSDSSSDLWPLAFAVIKPSWNSSRWHGIGLVIRAAGIQISNSDEDLQQHLSHQLLLSGFLSFFFYYYYFPIIPTITGSWNVCEVDELLWCRVWVVF